LITTEEQLPSRIFNAYKHSIEAFNSGMWPLAVTSCGRVLEGIGKTTFPNGSQQKQLGQLFNNLKSELKKTPDYKDLLQPLVDLGEAFRLGRNTGAHFDLEKEPDREVASQLIDLTEFLIKYIYLISKEVADVEQKISSLEPGDLNNEDSETNQENNQN
jgi:hypothetical protein